MDKKIVFCGGGNMAEGILKELIRKNVALPENITVNEIIPARCDYLNKTYNITAAADVTEAVKSADLVIIAVTPVHISSVTKMLNPLIDEKTVVMSIAAGVPINKISEGLGSDRKIVRIMPNTLGQSSNGYSAACMNEFCDDKDKTLVTDVITSLGQIMFLKEDMFNAFTAFSNVGPLWCYKMIEALVDAGVYVGFSRTDARNIAIKNMIGAATVLDITGEHPAIKVDQMTSPGGVTIEALKVLQGEGFSTALMDSVIAGFDKVNKVK